jgi:hypothetical protein
MLPGNGGCVVATCVGSPLVDVTRVGVGLMLHEGPHKFQIRIGDGTCGVLKGD